ncbi:hypothetical protein FGO68_gene12607 [Halteria grandinella]|uniref:RBR-type E3 ubiquitin transferase n=1 Tax=Halteria grandinella TaxID=5974 RepID=A0A8J8T922_HALGN|nr:hypothetical protein FGO68_gene12607 [Halteria grandinella]
MAAVPSFNKHNNRAETFQNSISSDEESAREYKLNPQQRIVQRVSDSDYLMAVGQKATQLQYQKANKRGDMQHKNGANSVLEVEAQKLKGYNSQAPQNDPHITVQSINSGAFQQKSLKAFSRPHPRSPINDKALHGKIIIEGMGDIEHDQDSSIDGEQSSKLKISLIQKDMDISSSQISDYPLQDHLALDHSKEHKHAPSQFKNRSNLNVAAQRPSILQPSQGKANKNRKKRKTVTKINYYENSLGLNSQNTHQTLNDKQRSINNRTFFTPMNRGVDSRLPRISLLNEFNNVPSKANLSNSRIDYNKLNYSPYFFKLDSQTSILDEATKQKLIIIRLTDMGIKEEIVERALLFGKARTLSNCLPFILPNEQGLMEHRFVSVKDIKLKYQNHDYCLLCIKKKKKATQKHVRQLNETIISRHNSRRSITGMFTVKREMTTQNNHALQSEHETEQQVVVMQNRALLCNQKFLRLQQELGRKVPRSNDQNEFMYTVQQDHNKSAFSIATNPGHQRTEVPGDFKKFFNRVENPSNESDEGSEEEDTERFQNNGDSLERNETRRHAEQSRPSNVALQNIESKSPQEGALGYSIQLKKVVDVQEDPETSRFQIRKGNELSNLFTDVENYNSQLGVLRSPKFIQKQPAFNQKMRLKHHNENNFIEDFTAINADHLQSFTQVKTKENAKNGKSKKHAGAYNYLQSVPRNIDNNNEVGGSLYSLNNSYKRDAQDKHAKEFQILILEQEDSNSVNKVSQTQERNPIALTSKGPLSQKEYDEFDTAAQEEKCFICSLPPEMHSPDWNMDQLEVQLRFNEQTAFDGATEHQNQGLLTPYDRNASVNTYGSPQAKKAKKNFIKVTERAQDNNGEEESKNESKFDINQDTIGDKMQSKRDAFKQQMRNRRILGREQLKTELKLANKSEREKGKSQCQICFEKIANTLSDTNSDPYNKHFGALISENQKIMIEMKKCKHIFCLDCIQEYLKFQVGNGRVFGICCPSCDQSILDSQIERLLSHDETLIDYKRLKLYAEYSNNDLYTICPNPRCQEVIALNSPNEFQVRCMTCYFEFCNLTKLPWHQGVSCKDHIEEIYGQAAKGKKLQMCPHCNQMIEKARFCNHITCTFCMKSFCIQCRQDYSLNHQTPFHSFICSLSGGSTTIRSTVDSSKASLSLIETILAALLLIILSPLFAIFVVPLCIARNYLAFKRSQLQRPLQSGGFEEKLKYIEKKIKAMNNFDAFCYSIVIYLIMMALGPISLILLYFGAVIAVINLAKMKRFSLKF